MSDTPPRPSRSETEAAILKAASSRQPTIPHDEFYETVFPALFGHDPFPNQRQGDTP